MFRRKSDSIVQTFTYYIPACSKSRKEGYREKEFDSLFYKFINQGFEIISINTQAHVTNEGPGGMWVMCTVRSTNDNSSKLDLNFVEDEGNYNNTTTVEGIYRVQNDTV